MKDKTDKKRLICRIVLSLFTLTLCILFWLFKIIDMIPEALISGLAFASIIAAVIAFVVLFQSLSGIFSEENAGKPEEMPNLGFRTQETEKLPPATVLKLTSVKSLLESWEIIEFVVSTPNGIIKLGASAETLPGRSEYINKEFYVGDKIYGNMNAMNAALDELFPEVDVEVFLIDEVEPKYWKIPC